MTLTGKQASLAAQEGPVRFDDGILPLRASRRECWLLAAVVTVALAYTWHRWHANFGGLQPFWDARVYMRGYRKWRAGLDPYLQTDTKAPENWLPFVSPPVFLYLMRALAFLFPGGTGLLAYGVLVTACTLATPVLLAVFYLRRNWMTPSLALLLTWFQPGKFGSQALLTGNLSNVLYAVILAAGVPGIRRGRWVPFYVVVAFAGAMKPPFLSFLLLPLLAGEGQWIGSMTTVAAVAVADAAQAKLLPEMWKAFEAAVVRRIFANGDAGFGLLAEWTQAQTHLRALQAVSGAVAVALLSGALVLLLFALRTRRGTRPGSHLWLPCIVVMALLANPRLLAYDVVVGCVPAIYLIVEFFRVCRPDPLKFLAAGFAALALIGVASANPEQGVFLLLLSSVLMGLAVQLWPSRLLPSYPDQAKHS